MYVVFVNTITAVNEEKRLARGKPFRKRFAEWDDVVDYLSKAENVVYASIKRV